jgi:hypothetical protein
LNMESTPHAYSRTEVDRRVRNLCLLRERLKRGSSIGNQQGIFRNEWLHPLDDCLRRKMWQYKTDSMLVTISDHQDSYPILVGTSRSCGITPTLMRLALQVPVPLGRNADVGLIRFHDVRERSGVGSRPGEESMTPPKGMFPATPRIPLQIDGAFGYWP